MAHISVEDADAGVNGEAVCSVDDNHFYVEPIYRNEYKVITRVTFDREIDPVISLPIECQDQGEPRLTSRQNIEITILDENDHSPIFTQKIYKIAIKENNTVGIPILRVNATDRDYGQNSRITYRLQGDAKGFVDIDPRTGVIRANTVFDYESKPFIRFGVVATDGGSPARSASATVKLEIQDINDEAPRFSKPFYEFTIFENQNSGTEIGTVSAYDADNPPYDVYSFAIKATGVARDVFAIDSDSGRITTRRVLDREAVGHYTFKVLAANPGLPSLTSTANITVHIADINDMAPMFLFPSLENSTIDAPHKGPIGYILGYVTARDDDFGINSKITYSIVKGNTEKAFHIDRYTGALQLNRRRLKHDRYRIMVEARDNGLPPKTAVAELTVNVNTSLVIADTGYNSPNRGLGSFQSGRNHIIAICIGAATLVLAIILIACIICIKRKQYCEKNRDTYKYICHVNNRAPARHNGPNPPDPEMTELTTTAVDGHAITAGTATIKNNKNTIVAVRAINTSADDESGGEKTGEYTKFVQPSPDDYPPVGQTKLSEGCLADAQKQTIHTSPKRQVRFDKMPSITFPVVSTSP